MTGNHLKTVIGGAVALSYAKTELNSSHIKMDVSFEQSPTIHFAVFYIGAVVGFSQNKIVVNNSKVHLKYKMEEIHRSYIGGACGYVKHDLEAHLTEFAVEAVVSGSPFAGGLAGLADLMANVKVENCLVRFYITSNDKFLPG